MLYNGYVCEGPDSDPEFSSCRLNQPSVECSDRLSSPTSSHCNCLCRLEHRRRSSTMAAPPVLPLLLLLLLLPPPPPLVEASTGYDYSDALAKSLLYYEAQRSGPLPGGQRASWRGDSALDDGKAEGVDLVGGYYDAGDNVKFGLPMAFTVTMLSWSVVEYGRQMQAAGQLEYALDSIRWGTDYLLKAHSEPLVLWGQVGDGLNDHGCWQRPEDMTTYRKAYKIDASNPGSDLAGETAAAMAAASICFRSADPSYSSILVEHAKQLFEFADKYRGKYDTSIPAARNFYTSKSGYADELLWASLWLYEATSEGYYLDYAAQNGAALGGTSWSIAEFSWDVKYPGVQVLASKILMQGRAGRHANVLMQYQSKASFVLCAALQKNEGVHIQRTPGGLMFVRPWNNMQYVVTAAYLLTIYSDYLASTNQALQCPGGSADPSELLQLAKSQVDYILGDNPRATSYLVGYGPNYPRQVHHRASSIVSIKVNSAFVSCRGGYNQWYLRNLGDPNVLVGALVGGPDQFDNFADERHNFEQTEPTSYNNGPLIGVLARLLEAPSYDSGKPRHSKNSAPVHMHALESSATETTTSVASTTPSTRLSTGQVVQITQRIVGSWRLRGDTNYKYEVTVKNTSGQRLSKLVLRITGLHGPYWGLTRTTPAATAGAASQNEETFTFPARLQSLPPLESLVFVYIHEAAAAEATVSLDSYTTS